MSTNGGYAFTKQAAERIARVVREFERGGRDQPPVYFRRSGDGDGGEPVRLAKTVDEINKNATGMVAVFDNATESSGENAACNLQEFPPRNTQVCATNLLEDIPAQCWVYIAKPENGNVWHIVGHANCAANDDDCGPRTDYGAKLTFSSCCGQGAKAHVSVGGDCPGPADSVVVDNGGSGYARKGRVEPELTISGGGTGATFTPSFTHTSGTCGDDTWAIASVSVSGGTGLAGGTTLSVVPQAGTTVTHPATLVLRTAAPTVTASAPGGSGAVLSVTLAASAGHPAGEAPYVVQSVSVTDGGTGYTNGASVTFTASGARLASSAVATIQTGTDTERVNPELTPYVWGHDGTPAGTGAVLSAVMSYLSASDAWEVASISITNGGSGYEVGEYVWYSQFPDVYSNNPPYYFASLDDWQITAVDENGAITALGAPGGNGQFYKNTTVYNGRIESVAVTNGGQYDSGVPSSVVVTNGGTFYQESDTATAYVPTIIVNVESDHGSDATFTAHVDDSPTSGTFGQITSVSVDNAGSGYVNTVNSGATKWQGLDFSTIAGYQPTETQMLGHDPGGCLKWFTTVSCETDTSGVCCIDNAVNGTYTTQAACETAGGTWKAGASSSDLPPPCCPSGT